MLRLSIYINFLGTVQESNSMIREDRNYIIAGKIGFSLARILHQLKVNPIKN